MSRLRSAATRAVAGHPVAAFLLIGISAGLATSATPLLAGTEIPPFDLPPYGVVGGILGVGLGAFVVTGATSGRAGVADLVRRSLRWRVPVRWYLVALLTVPAGATLLALAIYGPEALRSPSEGWPQLWRR